MLRIGIARATAAVVVLGLVPSIVAQTAPPGRPWLVKDGLEEQYRARAKSVGKDAAKLLELATWCQSHRLPHLTAKTLEASELTPETAPLLGLVPGSNPPTLIDSSRYGAAARALPSLAPLAVERKKQLLAGKDRTIKLAKQSTYFDINTDLEQAEIDLHSKMLNDFYRSMKNRFAAYPESNVDVVVFANRADYLLDYAINADRSGENVLGYFVPAWRTLFFYDDPYNREEIALIARHECTHLLFNIAYEGSALPDWLNEGMACYLAADGEAARGGYTMGLVLELMGHAQGAGLRIDDLFKLDHKDLKYEHYAKSWALVHYLSSEPRRAKFQKALVALRDVLDAEVDEPRSQTLVIEQLEAAFGEASGTLASGCEDFIESQFGFERPDQQLEIAYEAIERSYVEKSRIPPAQLIECATLALDAASTTLEGSDLARARFAELHVLVRRAQLGKASQDGWRLTLRALADGLRELPPLLDESRVGALVREAIESANEMHELKPPTAKPRDLVAELRGTVGKRQGVEAERFRGYVVVVEDLLEIAYGRLAKALEANPLHRRAARQWTLLSMEAVPAKLHEIFPLLKLAVERDPSDEAMATLGVAYIGLGHRAFGDAMLERAASFIAQPIGLAELMAWRSKK